MKRIIKLTEGDLAKIIKKVLNEQPESVMDRRAGIKIIRPSQPTPSQPTPSQQKKIPQKPKIEDINPKKLKRGDGGKYSPEKIKDVKKLQSELIISGCLQTTNGRPTGFFGPKTEIALQKYLQTGTCLEKLKTTNQKYDCIAVTKETCSKISPNRTVGIGGSDDIINCTQYARKCLSQYEEELWLGPSAWQSLGILKSRGGSVKYNMFKEMDFNQIEEKLKSLGYKSDTCVCFDTTDSTSTNVDIKCDKGKLNKMITDSYPQSSGVNLSSLELGDIVGMYYKDSGNKGKAFCQTAKIDPKGNIVNKNSTINTHLGFVGSIKNGVPIIFHNVHGHYSATPATKFMNKNSEAMITWVVTDPTLKKSLKEQSRKNIDNRGYVPPSDYLGKKSEFEKGLDSVKLATTKSTEKISAADLSYYKKNYPCMPTTNRDGDQIPTDSRDELYLVFHYIKTFKDKVKSSLGVPNDNILFYLFTLAVAGMDREGAWQNLKDYEGYHDVQFVKDFEWWGGLHAVKFFTGKEPSVGPFNMKPSVYDTLKGTQKLTGKYDSSKLWRDRLTQVLSVMEYYWMMYNRTKSKLGYTGPSVGIDGKPIPGLTGDFNWDVALSSYVFPEEKHQKKYCKTKNKDGSYNKDYAAPCDWGKTTYKPFSTPEEAKNNNRPWAGELIVQKNEVIRNYLPKLSWVKSDGRTNYSFIKNDVLRIQKVKCFMS